MRHSLMLDVYCSRILSTLFAGLCLLGVVPSTYAGAKASPAAAPARKDVNLLNLMGPVRSQGDTNICFAHAAADALTVKIGTRVSALSVAFRYYQKRSGLDYIFMNPFTGPFRAGIASSVLKTSAGSTLCSESQGPRDNSYNEADLLALKELYERKFRPYIGAKEPTALMNEITQRAHRLMPGLNARNFRALMHPKRPITEVLGLWMDKECHLRVPGKTVPRVFGGELQLQSPAQRLAIINRALDQNRVALIHYNADFLRNKKAKFYERALIGFHVSSIAGRRTVRGNTYYLLSNTVRTCDSYVEPWLKTCQKGRIWITASDIARHATSASFLE